MARDRELVREACLRAGDTGEHSIIVCATTARFEQVKLLLQDILEKNPYAPIHHKARKLVVHFQNGGRVTVTLPHVVGDEPGMIVYDEVDP